MPGPSLQFQAHLAQAHREGNHGADVTGYWRQTGCPLCADHKLKDSNAFELVTRHDLEAPAMTTWVLREVESRGVWTIVTFGHHPECDFAVGPWGDLVDGGFDPRRDVNVPAGVWHKLAEELA